MSRHEILIVNSNSTEAVTDKLRWRASTFAGDADCLVVTAANGPNYVSTPEDVAVAAPAVLDAIAQGVSILTRDPDACVIGCFGEPGIAAARHRFAFPVVGLAEASVMAALQMGDRYAIVTAGRHWPPMLRSLLRSYAIDKRCCAIEEVIGDPLVFATDRAAATAAVELAISSALRYRPDVIILGGASLLGLADELFCSVPVIDCFDAGMGQAIALSLLKKKRDLLRSN